MLAGCGKKYFINSVFVLLLVFVGISSAIADEDNVMCVPNSEVVDIITLLDASERDIDLLSSCEKLVADLYKEIEHKDVKINGLTNELITARQEVIKYKAKNKALKKITWYVVVGGAILVTIEILPAVL